MPLVGNVKQSATRRGLLDSRYHPPVSGNPARPRLRAVESFAAGGGHLGLRDPLGFSEEVILLDRRAVSIAALMDGRRDAAGIAAFLTARGEPTPVGEVETLARSLERAHLLEGPSFERRRAAVTAAFRASPRRPAHHAGLSYAASAAALRRELDGFAHRRAHAHQRPRAMVTPHIDFQRGGRSYATTYGALPKGHASDPPLLCVVLGTDHVGWRHPYTLTKKAHDTPLGPVACATDAVDALAEALGEEEAYADEVHHRTEHSVEFQAVWLRHALGGRPFEIVPVLCGSLHAHVLARRSPAREARIARFLDRLAEIAAGRETLLVAGADLAHVGPHFGDPHPLEERGREALEASDRTLLAACEAGDAEAFFDAIAATGDRDRICGLAPMYALLRMIPGARGRSVAYEQCPVPGSDGSWVSIAGVLWP